MNIIKVNEKMYIRLATPTDAYDIKKIHIETYQKSYRGYIPDDYLDCMSLDDETVAGFRKYLETTECFLVIYDENPVAFAFVGYPENGVFEINALYVHPKYQKCGAGSALVNYLCKDKKEQSFAKCIVWTMKFGPSLSFNEKMRFLKTSEEKNWKFNIPITKLEKIL